MDAQKPLPILRELISGERGAALIEDPRRCKALLLDYCGAHRREVNLLVKAHEEHVPARLLAPTADVPLTVVMAQLTRQLADDWGLADEAARWAVEAWAWALGLSDTKPDDAPALTSEPEQAAPDKVVEAEADVATPPAAGTMQQQRAYAAGQGAAPATRHPAERESGAATARRGTRLPAGSPLVLGIGLLLLLCLCGVLGVNLFRGRPTSTPTPVIVTHTPAPARPVLHSPEGKNNCVGTRLQLDLRWDAPASPHPVARYVIRVEPGVVPPNETAERRWVLDVPCASETYRWRVQAIDETGSIGPWSDWNHFAVDCISEVCTVTPQ